MSKKSIESRLTIVERLLKTAKGVIKEIYIQGGLSGPGIAVRAHIIGGQCYEGEVGEDFDSFQNRVMTCKTDNFFHRSEVVFPFAPSLS